MAPAAATTVRDTLDDGEWQRAWEGADADGPAPAAPIHRAQLTISRNTGSDFQDRQVYLFVDDEPWGKVKYGRPVTRAQVRTVRTVPNVPMCLAPQEPYAPYAP